MKQRSKIAFIGELGDLFHIQESWHNCNVCGYTFSEGLPGVLGNKETLAKYPREQGNTSLFLGNRGTKLYKLEDENIVSKFITRGTNTENVWEHGNIGQFCKGTRQQGPPGDPLFPT